MAENQNVGLDVGLDVGSDAGLDVGLKKQVLECIALNPEITMAEIAAGMKNKCKKTTQKQNRKRKYSQLPH